MHVHVVSIAPARPPLGKTARWTCSKSALQAPAVALGGLIPASHAFSSPDVQNLSDLASGGVGGGGAGGGGDGPGGGGGGGGRSEQPAKGQLLTW